MLRKKKNQNETIINFINNNNRKADREQKTVKMYFVNYLPKSAVSLN